jgi:hypothetical protein
MRRPAVTTYLDLLGVCCLVLFAFAAWPPACLLVVGVTVLLISRRRVR